MYLVDQSLLTNQSLTRIINSTNQTIYTSPTLIYSNPPEYIYRYTITTEDLEDLEKTITNIANIEVNGTYNRNLTETQTIYKLILNLTNTTCPSGWATIINISSLLEEEINKTPDYVNLKMDFYFKDINERVYSHVFRELESRYNVTLYNPPWKPPTSTPPPLLYICLHPENASIVIANYSYLYHELKYTDSSTSYDRYHWIAPNCSVYNKSSVSNIILFDIGAEEDLIPTDLVTETIRIVDTDGNNIEDAIVKVLRQLEDGEYYPVEITKTNSEGIAIARLVAYRALYKFIIEKDCESLLTTTTTPIYESSLTITVPTSLLGGENEWFQLYQNLFIYYNLTYNDTDWRLTFSDPSENTRRHCLEVWIDEYPTKRLNSSTCIVASSGSIELPFIANTSQEAIYKVENIPITTKKYTYTDNRRELFKDVGGIFISLLFQALIIGISMTIGSPLFFFYASPIVTIASYHLGILPVSAGIAYAYSLIILIIGIISTYRRGS